LQSGETRVTESPRRAGESVETIFARDARETFGALEAYRALNPRVSREARDAIDAR